MRGVRSLAVAVAAAVMVAVPGAGGAPAGGRIAWVSDEFETTPTRLLAIRLGGGTVKIAPEGERPVVSRDGRRIAYEVTPFKDTPVEGDTELWTVNAGGSGRRRLGPGAEPSWSPDARRLAFVRDGRVVISRSDGTNVRPLDRGRAPSWSPNGKLLAYVSGPSLFVTPVNRLTRKRLGPAGRSISWSPDSNRLVTDIGPKLLLVVGVTGRSRKTIRTRYFVSDPVWSPRGDEIAYIDDERDLFTYVMIVTPEGKRRRLVGEGEQPAWSPDGTRLAFGETDGSLYVARRDGKARRLGRGRYLADFDVGGWTRGGRAVVVATRHYEDKNDKEIYTSRPDGSQRRQITHTDAEEADPEWSPNGRSLAFAVYGHAGDERGVDVRVMNAGGSGVRTIVRQAFDPAWSPDGKAIVFTRAGSGLAIVPAAGGAIRPLTVRRGYSLDKQSTWSPDGEWIAFQRDGQLSAILPDGTGRRVLAARDGAQQPDWSPDGTRIAYLRENENSATLWIIDADGTHRRKLAGGVIYDGQIGWSPDGNWIVAPTKQGALFVNPATGEKHLVEEFASAKGFTWRSPPTR